MRVLCKILLMFLLMLSLCGCRREMVTAEDEFTMQNWTSHTKSGMSAELIFDEHNATVKVYDSDSKLLTVVEGVYAIDNRCLYITDSALCKTYSFVYRVFGNRAELEYAGQTLEFYPDSHSDEASTPTKTTE